MLFRKDLEPCCAYCTHGSYIDDESVICVKKGVVKSWGKCRRFEYANVSEGSVLGRAVFLCDTNGDGTWEEVGNAPLKALYTVPKKASKNKFRAWIKSLFD